MQWHLRNDHPNEQRRDNEFVGIVIIIVGRGGGGFGGGRCVRHATAASRRCWFVGENRRPGVRGSSRGVVVVVAFFETSSDSLHRLRHGGEDHGKPNHPRSETDATKGDGGK